MFARTRTLVRLRSGSNVLALFGLTILLPGVLPTVFGVRRVRAGGPGSPGPTLKMECKGGGRHPCSRYRTIRTWRKWVPRSLFDPLRSRGSRPLNNLALSGPARDESDIPRSVVRIMVYPSSRLLVRPLEWSWRIWLLICRT